jgi:hypothetical protein
MNGTEEKTICSVFESGDNLPYFDMLIAAFEIEAKTNDIIQVRT